MTEKVLIIYYQAKEGAKSWLSDTSSHQSKHRNEQTNDTPNAFEFHPVNPGKEIYLSDLLSFLPSSPWQSYHILAYTTIALTKAITVQALTCVLPVLSLDSMPMIVLHLYPSHSVPIVSPSDGPMYMSLSRHELYAPDNAMIADQQARYRGTTTDIHSPRYTKSQVFSPTSTGNPVSNVNDSKSLPQRPKNSNQSNDTRQETASSSQFMSDESVAAIAEAAKETAGTLAKSFLSFASSTMKNVAEVTTTAANMSITGLAAATATTVGKTKVVIIRELADGGFGKVYLVNDAMQPMKQYAMKQMHCQSGKSHPCSPHDLNYLLSYHRGTREGCSS